MTRLLAAFVLMLWLPLQAAADAAPAVAPAATVDVAAAARTIVLVRHGHYVEDDSADENVGPPLSPLGLAQARLAGAALAALPDFDHRYVSPMQRARDTAAAIVEELPGPPFEVVPDLAECTPPTRRVEITVDEKLADLVACRDKLDRMFARFFVPATGVGSNDLIVCHGNVIRYLVTRALGVDSTAWLEMSVRHASFTVIRVEADGRFKVIAVGDVGHIPPGLRSGATGDPERSLALPVVDVPST